MFTMKEAGLYPRCEACYLIWLNEICSKWKKRMESFIRPDTSIGSSNLPVDGEVSQTNCVHETCHLALRLCTMGAGREESFIGLDTLMGPSLRTLSMDREARLCPRCEAGHLALRLCR